MRAVKNKSPQAAVDAVKCLLKLGADVNVTNAEGRTVLHLAAQKNLPEVVSLLTESGIDLDATDHNGDTAYVTAIKYDSPAALQSLIDTDCDRSIDGLMGTAVGLASVQVAFHDLTEHTLSLCWCFSSCMSLSVGRNVVIISDVAYVMCFYADLFKWSSALLLIRGPLVPLF